MIRMRPRVRGGCRRGGSSDDDVASLFDSHVSAMSISRLGIGSLGASHSRRRHL